MAWRCGRSAAAICRGRFEKETSPGRQRRVPSLRRWRFGLVSACLLLFDDPNVAEDDRIAVILQQNRAADGRFLSAAVDGTISEFKVIVDDDAIVLDGHHGIGHLLTVLEARRLKVDVVRLPG